MGCASAGVRVVLADDHRLVLRAVRHSLEDAGGFEVVGEARSGGEVLDLSSRTQPDVVLLDLRMPDIDGFDCLQELRRRHPEVTVIVLSAVSDPEVVAGALERGASAYVVKSVDPPDLPAVIRRAREGTVPVPLGLPDQTPASLARTAGLTPREHQVLVMVAEGRANAEIARELSLTPHTIKAYLSRIYRRLHVQNRTHAVRAALELGLVERHDPDRAAL